MGEIVRLGMIGAGNIGDVHINQFKRLSDVEITGITSASLPHAQSKAMEHQIPKVYRSTEELISDSTIDAVVVGVPNKYHAKIAIQALQAGKHVLLEKPMALNLHDARDIIRAHRESQKVLMIPHQLRWESVAMQVKEQIDKRALGKIYSAKAGCFRRKGIPGWGTWFTRKDISGGGPLIDIGVHMLDLSLHLMGNPKPVSVYGSTYAEFGPKKRGIGTWGKPNWDGIYDVEDSAMAMIKMEDGSILTLEVSWAVHGEIEKNGSFIHLMGSEGGASIHGDEGKLFKEMFDRPMETTLKTLANDEGARARLSRHFIECIKEGKEPITSAMTGFTNNLILDAIYESSRTGREMVLDWSI